MNKKKIVIIEDEEDVSYVLGGRLTKAGYQILTLPDAVRGLEGIHKFAPDLIILDMMLPAGGGLFVLESLRKMSQAQVTPVIVLTGSTDQNLEKSAQALGVVAYIKKPYEFSFLLGKVQEALEKA